MTDIFCSLISLMPFDWAKYHFMQNAMLAVIIVTPMFGMLGTIVVNNRMAFFSDVLGHSALTGVALGVILGAGDPFWAMMIFIVCLSALINYIKRRTAASFDTILGVFLAFAMALGIVILSKGGGFARYTSYLIGDILAVSGEQILTLAALFAVSLLFWIFCGNSLTLSSVSSVLARSRGAHDFWVQTLFTLLLAVIIGVSIRLVGILIINSLLILPAAAARSMASNMRSYTILSVAISLVSGVAGLITSYYWGSASGATIVLFAAAFYALAALCGRAKTVKIVPSE